MQVQMELTEKILQARKVPELAVKVEWTEREIFFIVMYVLLFLAFSYSRY